MKTYKDVEKMELTKQEVEILCSIWNVPEGLQTTRLIDYRYENLQKL